jgi:hypothetical protein
VSSQIHTGEEVLDEDTEIFAEREEVGNGADGNGA